MPAAGTWPARCDVISSASTRLTGRDVSNADFFSFRRGRGRRAVVNRKRRQGGREERIEICTVSWE